jgi:hypothetical protein
MKTIWVRLGLWRWMITLYFRFFCKYNEKVQHLIVDSWNGTHHFFLLFLLHCTLTQRWAFGNDEMVEVCKVCHISAKCSSTSQNLLVSSFGCGKGIVAAQNA